jgi:hypothetical protein
VKYLIDTDWIIDHLKGDERVTRKLEALASEGMAVSAISLAKIYEGVYYSKDPVKSKELFEEFLASEEGPRAGPGHYGRNFCFSLRNLPFGFLTQHIRGALPPTWSAEFSWCTITTLVPAPEGLSDIIPEKISHAFQ